MAENLNIRINLNVSDLQGTSAALRQIDQLRQAMGATGERGNWNVRLNFVEPSTEGITRAVRRIREMTQRELDAQTAGLFGFGRGIPGAQGEGTTRQALTQAQGLYGNAGAIGVPLPTVAQRLGQARAVNNRQLAEQMAAILGFGPGAGGQPMSPSVLAAQAASLIGAAVGTRPGPRGPQGWAGWTAAFPPGHASGGWGGWASMLPPSAGTGWGGWTGMMPPPGGPPGGGWGAWTGMVPPGGASGWSAWTGMMPAGHASGGWGGWTSMMPHGGGPPDPWWMRILSRMESGVGAGIAAMPRAYMGAAGGIESGVAGALRGGVGLVGGTASALYGAVHRPAGLALGAVAGLGVYQVLTESMELYRQRAQGVIDIGMRTNQSFQQTRTTINSLRDSYQVLTHDSLAAMDAMSRVTGRLDQNAMQQAVGFGLAYGLEPAHAAGVAGTLSRLGVGTHPLARAFAGARAGFGTGGLPMRGDVLADEITRVAAIGGAAALPMGIGFYGNLTGMIAGMGERYRVPGAPSDFAERLTAGATQAPDAGVRMLRFRAIENLRRSREAAGLGSMLRLGEGPEAMNVDLRTYLGQTLAMENPTANPAILEAYARQNERTFGFDPTLSALMYPRLVGGGQMNITEGLRLRQRTTAGGGFARILGAAPNVGGEVAIAQGALAARAQQPEFDVQRIQAAMEGRLEELGKSLVGVSNDLKGAVLKLSTDFQNHQLSLDSLRKALEGMDDTTKKFMGALGLAGGGPVGATLGAGLLMSGMNNWFEGVRGTMTPGSVASGFMTGLEATGNWIYDAIRAGLAPNLNLPARQPQR